MKTEYEIIFSDYRGISRGYVHADSEEEARKFFKQTHPNISIIDVRVHY